MLLSDIENSRLTFSRVGIDPELVELSRVDGDVGARATSGAKMSSRCSSAIPASSPRAVLSAAVAAESSLDGVGTVACGVAAGCAGCVDGGGVATRIIET